MIKSLELNFFTYRETKRENYRILTKRRMNRQKYYIVEFKRWLFGWQAFEKPYDRYSREQEFENENLAEKFILVEISKAYDKLLK